ncbi:MAG TPA: hypothetical protein VNC22_22915 [Sporichthya sp.]|jgi:lysophospholipase L1-like esterase|nr:hypothetical protein [Sporichthya sp.]
MLPQRPSTSKPERTGLPLWCYLAIAAGALVTAWSLFGCAPPSGGHNPVIVGDSIAFTAQLDGELTKYMPNIFMDNQPGRGMYRKGILTNPDGSWRAGTSGAEAIPPILTWLTPGGWTVIELGTNDMDLDPTMDEASISELLRLVPGCVAWVNVWNNQNDATRLRSRQFNVAIVNAVSKRKADCTKIINWAGEAEIHAFDYLKDGVHPTPLGSAKLAQLIKAATG